MRHTILALAFLAASASPVLAHPAATASATPYTGAKWEYRIEQMLGGNVDGLPGVVTNMIAGPMDAKKLEELGKDGWELVAMQGGRAIFKRLVVPPPSKGWWPFW